MCWSRYQDASPVPTSPLAWNISTEPSGLVTKHTLCHFIYLDKLKPFARGGGGGGGGGAGTDKEIDIFSFSHSCLFVVLFYPGL